MIPEVKVDGKKGGGENDPKYGQGTHNAENDEINVSLFVSLLGTIFGGPTA